MCTSVLTLAALFILILVESSLSFDTVNLSFLLNTPYHSPGSRGFSSYTLITGPSSSSACHPKVHPPRLISLLPFIHSPIALNFIYLTCPPLSPLFQLPSISLPTTLSTYFSFHLYHLPTSLSPLISVSHLYHLPTPLSQLPDP